MYKPRRLICFMNESLPRQQIIEVLKKHPEGLTITAISKLTKLHRHTVTKYIYELRGADLIIERMIGPAKLCYLKNGCTTKKERETIRRLENRMKSSFGSLGQIQLFTIFVFLVLAPVALITAYNLTNSTNETFSLEGYITAESIENTSNETNEIFENESFFGSLENITIENTFEATTTEENEAIDEYNLFNETNNEAILEPFNESNATEINEVSEEEINVSNASDEIVEDKNPPLISEVKIEKIEIYENERVKISAKVSDESEIKEVKFLIEKKNSNEIFEYEGIFDGNEYYIEFSGEQGRYLFSRVLAKDIFDNLAEKNIALEFEILPILDAEEILKNINIRLSKKSFKLGEKIEAEILLDENLLLLIKEGKVKFKNKNLKDLTQSFKSIKKLFKILLVDPEGNEKEIPFTNFGKIKKVLLDTGRNYRPGLYKIKLIVFEGSESETTIENEFALGLVNINTDKSIYLPGEEAKIFIGVLNSYGSRVDDANVYAKVFSPSGEIGLFSTGSGTIKNEGDGLYTFIYTTKEKGTYKIEVHAESFEVSSDYETKFEVRDYVEFDIRREAPTITYLDGDKVTIWITPEEDAENVSVVEYVPSSWNITIENFEAHISENSENKTITWFIGSVKKGESFALSYYFDPPDVSPALALLGPLEIVYNQGETFKEARQWTIAIDAIWYYFATWTIRLRNTNTVVDPMTLCRNENYTIAIQIVDTADDTNSPTQNWYLQVLPEGQASYLNLPSSSAGWLLWNADTNPHNFAGMGTSDESCSNSAATDKCHLDIRYVRVDTTAETKRYKLRLYPSSNPASFKFQTNIIDVNVINCTNVDLKRSIKVFSPAGEYGKVNRGHVGIVALPLTNYNTSPITNVNATLLIYDDSENLMNWFIYEGNTQLISSLASSEEKVLLWHFLVPDDAPLRKYTAKIILNYSELSNPRIYDTDFSLYMTPEGSPTNLVIYRAAPHFESSDDYPDYNYYRFAVCNYGDYNITANLTLYASGQSASTSPVIEYNDTTPTNPTVSYAVINWYNANVNTSSCWQAWIRFASPGESAATGTFLLEAVWINPETGQQESNYDIFDWSGHRVVTTGLYSWSPRFNITRISANETSSVNFVIRNGGATSTTNGDIYVVDLYVPPGFNISTFSRAPDPGYPFGSPYEGWHVRWSMYGLSGGYINVNVGRGVDLAISSFTLKDMGISQFAPGGRAFTIKWIGWGGYTKTYQYHTDQLPLIVLGPWMKTIRYYNTTSSEISEGFPTTFACGNFSTTLQVFNKGNIPAYNFNITENKANISVTHPSDLIFSNFVPNYNYTIPSTKIIWGVNNINFTATGKDNAKNYTYLIQVPYQTNGTFTFYALPLNATPNYTFFDENYTIFIACGASLSMNPLTIPQNVTKGQSFNVSTLITNYGPGTASNTYAWITLNESFVAYNKTGQQSKEIFVGDLPLFGYSTLLWTIDTSNIECNRKYNITIHANATENSTDVNQTAEIEVLCPPKTIRLENARVNSTGPGSTGTNTDSWGFNFTFNVSVWSDATTPVSIYAWRSLDQMGWYQVGEPQIYNTPGTWQNYTFVWDPSCSDLTGDSTTWYYKFNATDGGSTINQTSVALMYLQKENLYYEILTDSGVVANRSGNQTTSLIVRAIDRNGTILSDFPLKFYVTTNNLTYYTDSYYIVSTNQSGHANFAFNATCANEYLGSPKFAVGEQQWKVTINDSKLSCYFQNDSSSSVQRNLFVWGEFKISNQAPDQTIDPSDYYTRGDNIHFASVIRDDCNDPLDIDKDSVTARFYAVGPILGKCEDVTSPVTGYFECTWNSINASRGWYNATTNASAPYFYNKTQTSYNETLGGWFYIKTPPDLMMANVTPRLTGSWAEGHNFTVRVD
ncbi:MAG: hypothetical protein QW051_00105, partial [Candidatus Aenigmatarchaeota archaeon]